ncbi:MAG: sensor histidine kinase [Candidatus Sulfotelmatobacter sp.]
MRNLRILTPIPIHSVGRRYIVAILAGVLAILLRWLLDPVLGHVAFYATVYIAVAYCAVVCGSRPAIVSGAIGFLGVFYWFVDPRYSFRIITVPQIHGIVGCVFVSSVLIGFGQTNRNKQLRLNNTIDALTTEASERQRAEAELRKAHDELERRVIERTAELSQALRRLESEIAVREQAESQLRHLSLRLMTLQDEERRRIARDLHDTAGQTLAAIKMSIALIRQIDGTAAGLQPLIDDLDALADEALQEVRTTSYLLHPPLLDEAGIASAARWFVEGFARRSGIQVNCDVPDKMERPPRVCELVLFRILQESLTNVHRHSGASAANIRLARANHEFQLEVSDNGKGISEERLRRFETSPNKAGVGITGMRERVRELGGQIEIKSLNPGTCIRVTLPTTIHASVPDPGSPVELAS